MTTTTTTTATTCNCDPSGKNAGAIVQSGDMGPGGHPKVSVQVTYHDLVSNIADTGAAGSMARLCLGQLYLEAGDNVNDPDLAQQLVNTGNILLRDSTSGFGV